MGKKNFKKIQEILELLDIDNITEKEEKKPTANKDLQNNKKIVEIINQKNSISNNDNNNFNSDTNENNNNLDLEKQYNLFLNEYNEDINAIIYNIFTILLKFYIIN